MCKKHEIKALFEKKKCIGIINGSKDQPLTTKLAKKKEEHFRIIFSAQLFLSVRVPITV
jgi:hypothetical protein